MPRFRDGLGDEMSTPAWRSCNRPESGRKYASRVRLHAGQHRVHSV